MAIKFCFGKGFYELDIKSDYSLLGKDFKGKEVDLREIFSNVSIQGKKIGLILPDTTRPLPAKEILSEIYPKISDKNITIFIGTGTHRNPTEEELKNYLGDFREKFKIVINDSKSSVKYQKIGLTERGTEVEILKEILAQDQIIAFTVVRPHYYAGFSGGRKIFIPGVSSYKTIQQNHRLVLDPDPKKGKNPYAVLAYLEKNPVHLDMMDVLKLVPLPCTFLNFVIFNKKIVYFSKDFFEAVCFVKENFQLEVKEKFDTLIISAGGFPFDTNFIQGHKALEHSIGALKEGGKIFAYIEAKEGFGSKDCIDFLKIGSIEGITEKLREDFKVYGHTALTILMKAKRFEVNLCTALSDEDLKLMGYKRWDGKTLPENLGKAGVIEQASLYYIPQRI
ncbi:MAG: lactate racemase domain-containing protein [Thermoanaerobaculia bacterium]